MKMSLFIDNKNSLYYNDIKDITLSTGYDPKFLNWWKERGATIFFCGFDSGFVHSGATAMLDDLENNVKNAK